VALATVPCEVSAFRIPFGYTNQVGGKNERQTA
jgi:hypothetical protein